MENIININTKSVERQRYEFRVRLLTFSGTDGAVYVPCIGLYEISSGMRVGTPRIELYYMDPAGGKFVSKSTSKKSAHAICALLNSLLWSTKCNTLAAMTISDFRRFLTDYRKKKDGSPRNSDEWSRGIEIVVKMLVRYYMANHEKYTFAYTPDELLMLTKVVNRHTGRTETVEKPARYGVKPPDMTAKKGRFLLEEYGELLLLECEKYDPDIALAVAAQMYGGLRAGEVVNLTPGRIKEIRGGFGTLSAIELDLLADADFAKTKDLKTEFGSIKKKRVQKIYDDFLGKFRTLRKRHMEYLLSRGIEPDPDDPLFYEKTGSAMTVADYSMRLKTVFYDHFLPKLNKLCKVTGDYARHAPHIERYEKEYPGAHSLRHWFTMYLVTHLKANAGTDIAPLIMMWRGDRSPASMMDYIHINADFIALYKKSGYSVQRELMAEVFNDDDI